MKSLNIKYSPRLENRTENGGFGPSRCSKCGVKVTCYLELQINDVTILLCKGCLYEGIKMINNTIFESYKDVSKKI